MIEVKPWTRKHRSMFASWSTEPNQLLPALLLRSEDEPYQYDPKNLGVLADGSLVARFTYRILPGGLTFVGIVVNPAFRGCGLSVPALRACLCYLGRAGHFVALASVALANTPSECMLRSAGFQEASKELRPLPPCFDVSLLDYCKTDTYYLAPSPMMVYSRMWVSLSPYMYADVA